MNPALEAEIEGLRALDLAQLRERWREVYGTPAPRFFRRDLLVRAIAYQLQVKVYGGLSSRTKRLLGDIAKAAREGTFEPAMAAPRINPGTRLIREWRGETHVVSVLEDGFEWKGDRHRSLSTIAKLITGTSWNGWKFFGVKRAIASDGRDQHGRFKRPTETNDGARMWPRTRRTRERLAVREGADG